jgi:hypothetical protein
MYARDMADWMVLKTATSVDHDIHVEHHAGPEG